MCCCFCVYSDTSSAEDAPACAPGVSGFAQVRPMAKKVFVRMRSGCADTTPFGLFVFDVETGRWETAGAAVNFSEPVVYNDVKLEPNSFFYSRGGYESIQLVNTAYAISVRDGRVVITASGLENRKYESEPLAPGPENRRFLFTYISGMTLWFDMRVKGDAVYSEGVGRFDTSDGSFRIYPGAVLGFESGRTLVTRMSEFHDNVVLGTSVCETTSCLEHGSVVFIPVGDDAEPKVYNASNANIPPGAVLDLEPDGAGIWVASSKGITLWYPDKKKNSIYRPGNSIRVNSPAKLRLCAYCLAAEKAVVPDGSFGVVTRLSDGGFEVALSQQTPAWAMVPPDLKFEDNGKTLVIEPGQKVTFHETASASSPLMGELQTHDAAVKLPVLDNSDAGVRVDLSPHIWLSQTEVIFSMQKAK